MFAICKACVGSARSARSIENAQLGLVLTRECLHIRDLMFALEKWKGSLVIDRGPAFPLPLPPSLGVTFPLLLSFTDLAAEGWSHRAVTDRREAFHCLVDGRSTPMACGAAVGRMRAMSKEMEEVATGQ